MKEIIFAIVLAAIIGFVTRGQRGERKKWLPLVVFRLLPSSGSDRDTPVDFPPGMTASRAPRVSTGTTPNTRFPKLLTA